MTPAELVTWRAEHRLSQRKLAGLLDIRHTTVFRWEKGTTPIPRTVEYALYWLGEHLQEAAVQANDEPVFSDADRLILALCNEHGDDTSRPLANIHAFRMTHLERDIEAATSGDKRALIRLRKAMGLPAFAAVSA